MKNWFGLRRFYNKQWISNKRRRVHQHQGQFESDSETHVPQTSNQTLNVNFSIDRQNTEYRLSNIDQSSSEKESGVIDLNFEQVISSDKVIGMGSDCESTDILWNH